MSLKKRLLSATVACMVGLAVFVPSAQAADLFGKACEGDNKDTAVCTNKDEGATREEAATQVQEVINIILFALGIIAVIMIVYGGFRFVSSSGDPGQVKTARDTVMYAAIGLIVALLAYAIVNFVAFGLQG